jgi:hypothetical protein
MLEPFRSCRRSIHRFTLQAPSGARFAYHVRIFEIAAEWILAVWENVFRLME